jgi:hypothetical protein
MSSQSRFQAVLPVLVVILVLTFIFFLLALSLFERPKEYPITFTARGIETFLENCGFGSCTKHLVVTTEGKVYHFGDESWAVIEPNHQYWCLVKESDNNKRVEGCHAAAA